jgi:hypothetical protein
MCKHCEEITWEIEETTCRTLSFLESDALDMWKRIVESHIADQIATFLTQIVELSTGNDHPSIHPLIRQFFSTYEKILTHSEKKFVFFEHFCLIAFSKGQ